jgi:glutamyl-tRNA synthetase
MDAHIKEWIERAAKFEQQDIKALQTPFAELDAHLTLRSYIVGYKLTDADATVYKKIRENPKAKTSVKQGLFRNVSRWYKNIEETNPALVAAAAVVARPDTFGVTMKEGDNFEIGLQDTEHGVVTRFPPEPSYVYAICSVCSF